MSLSHIPDQLLLSELRTLSGLQNKEREVGAGVLGGTLEGYEM
jgi:hypothetical protein